MKKFFTFAFVALATVFAVSCDKDEDKSDVVNTNTGIIDEPEIMNLVGTSWELNFEGTVQGMFISMDEVLNFTSETEGNRHVDAILGPQNASEDDDFTYTWDGSSLSVIIEESTRTLLYRESDDTFYMPLDGDPDMAQIAQILGVTELVYHRIR